MNVPSWLRELYEASKMWIPLVALLAWFWFWFSLLAITAPWLIVLVMFFNPYTLRAIYRLWDNRESLILPYEFMKSFWRQRREMKKQQRREKEEERA